MNPVDDALMKITHVLRGEDLLPSTPRQIALYEAMIRIGVTDSIPAFAHLPSVLGEGTKKLSKRDPQSNLFLHRDRGFIPEGLLNYLALLGWSIADDHDIFSLAEMVTAFDVTDVNSNPARFDQKKADAINAEHIRLLAPEEFVTRLRTYFAAHGHELGLDESAFAVAADLVQTRIVVLGDAWGLLKFLNDDAYAIDPGATARNSERPRCLSWTPQSVRWSHSRRGPPLPSRVRSRAHSSKGSSSNRGRLSARCVSRLRVQR